MKDKLFLSFNGDREKDVLKLEAILIQSFQNPKTKKYVIHLLTYIEHKHKVPGLSQERTYEGIMKKLRRYNLLTALSLILTSAL